MVWHDLNRSPMKLSCDVVGKTWELGIEAMTNVNFDLYLIKINEVGFTFQILPTEEQIKLAVTLKGELNFDVEDLNVKEKQRQHLTLDNRVHQN